MKECIGKTPISTVLVHKTCRRDFTNPKRAHLNVDNDFEHPLKKLRSIISPFNWKEDCMLCGESAEIDPRHPDRSSVHKVTTLPVRSKLLECCEKRRDLWANEVQTHLLGCFDLVAVEARYHDTCFSRFMLNKAPKANSTKNHGRHVDPDMLLSFEKLCTWLECEGDAELYTLAELHAKMFALSPESDVYSIKRLKQKIMQVGVAAKCMHTNFGGFCLSSFRDKISL